MEECLLTQETAKRITKGNWRPSMDNSGCLAILLIIGVLVIIGISHAAYKKSQGALQESSEAYQASLDKLRQDPTNSSLRQETLRLGRDYSSLTRSNKSVSIFDEVALMNDIQAACAGAIRTHGTSAARQAGPSIDERLENLESLRSKGLVSEEEYQTKRQQMIDEI